MKSILLIAVLALTSIGFLPTDANAQQIRVQIGGNRQDDRYRDRRYRRNKDRDRRVRFVTRDVRYGRRLYRETYRVEYRYGRQMTTLISRVRIY